jgi:hypothetical protein
LAADPVLPSYCVCLCRHSHIGLCETCGCLCKPCGQPAGEPLGNSGVKIPRDAPPAVPARTRRLAASPRYPGPSARFRGALSAISGRQPWVITHRSASRSARQRTPGNARRAARCAAGRAPAAADSWPRHGRWSVPLLPVTSPMSATASYNYSLGVIAEKTGGSDWKMLIDISEAVPRDQCGAHSHCSTPAAVSRRAG